MSLVFKSLVLKSITVFYYYYYFSPYILQTAVYVLVVVFTEVI